MRESGSCLILLDMGFYCVSVCLFLFSLSRPWGARSGFLSFSMFLALLTEVDNKWQRFFHRARAEACEKANGEAAGFDLNADSRLELMLKPEKVCPLFPNAAKEQFERMQDLARERIASSKENHRIQFKVKDVKHVTAAVV